MSSTTENIISTPETAHLRSLKDFKIKKLISRYYGFTFFFQLLLWLPVFYEYQKAIGLTDPEIFGIQSFYYIVFCLFEIPTGFFADRFGYTKSIALGALTLVAANILPIALPSVIGMTIHFTLIALARSLVSGAQSAFLYEALRVHNASEHYKWIEGRARSISLVGKVIGLSAVGYLMAWNVTLPYWGTTVNALIALWFALELHRLSKELPAQTKEVRPFNLFLGMGDVFATIFQRRHLLLPVYIVQGIGVFIMLRVVLVNLFQPILGSQEFNIKTYGWIMAALTLCEAIGSAKVNFVKRHLEDVTAVSLLSSVLSLSLILVAKGDPILTVFALCLFSLASGFIFPIQRQLVNDQIHDHSMRARILSLESLVDRGVCAFAVLPFGGMLAAGRLNEILYLAAAGNILSIFFVFIGAHYIQLKTQKQQESL